MKLQYIRCAICLTWHGAHHHCQTCGAFHVVVGGVQKNYNARGIEMVRGLPIDLWQVPGYRLRDTRLCDSD